VAKNSQALSPPMKCDFGASCLDTCASVEVRGFVAGRLGEHDLARPGPYGQVLEAT
jgi:hypothetical protein